MRWMTVVAGVAVLAGADLCLEAQQAPPAKVGTDDGDDGVAHRAEREASAA